MEKPEILIVDDEPINLTVLRMLLAPTYRVRACKSGEDALRLLGIAPKPDLVLMDIMMPGMDGYTTLKGIRGNPKTTDIPVMYISALDSSIDEEKGLQLGAVDYIGKPFKPAIVLERIKVHLELKEARDRLKNQNEWLEAEVERRIRENQLIQDAAMSVIVQLIETRDADTANHTLRTKAYVEILARRLQKLPGFAQRLDDVALDRIVKATPLHDLGKIGIPDAILLKPGKLTPEEFEIMKKHCIIGGNAIKSAIRKAGLLTNSPLEESNPVSFMFLVQAQEIAMYHHERWDGTGYPEALAGEAIPLSARLMALADVFDALTTPRVYKNPWSFEETTTYIQQQKGKQFDPDMVDAFIAEQVAFKQVLVLLADD